MVSSRDDDTGAPADAGVETGEEPTAAMSHLDAARAAVRLLDADGLEEFADWFAGYRRQRDEEE